MTRRAIYVFAVAAALLVVGWPGTAAAQSVADIKLEFKISPAPDKKDSDDKPVPTIEATIINGPLKPAATDFELVDKTAKPPVIIKGSTLKTWLQSGEKVAVAIVMHGWEPWVGNETEVPEVLENSPDRYIGALVPLRAALDQLKFKELGPPGSLGMIVTYNDKPKIQLAMGPLERLSGSALGSQKDYYQTTGSELVSGIRLAMTELRQAAAPKKVLIVVGDGRDTNMDTAKVQLADLKKQAETDQIKAFAIVYRSKLSGEGTVINAMIPQPVTVTSVENIAAGIKAILDRINDRQYVTFKTFDFTTKLGLTWDGKPHDLAIKIGQDETDPVSTVLVPEWEPFPKGFPWMIVLIVVGSVIFLLLIIIIIAKRKPAAMPMPAPMPHPAMPGVAAAPAPEPPKPMGPAKTVMIGVGGNEGGFPVVGWLVPLNGPNAYQTLRLRSSNTKIGTAPPADLVINDGFMSTEHCQIQCSPQGYTLVDGGSTNGCYVNDKRVSKHELVDNDTITLGKTNFKFKSIV